MGVCVCWCVWEYVRTYVKAMVRVRLKVRMRVRVRVRVCVCVCVCMCARVRAIPGTQAALLNAALVREHAPKADTQGQTVLHLIAWRASRTRTLRAMIRGRFGWVA